MASRAQTLWERLESLRLRPARSTADADSARLMDQQGEDERALAEWTRAVSPGDYAALLRRLSWDGIEPGLARMALTGPEPSPLEEPGWTATVEAFLSEAASLVESGLVESIAETEPWATGTEPPFAELCVPACRVAIGRLGAAARSTFRGEVRHALVRQLIQEIGFVTSAALYKSFEAFRVEPVAGSTTQYRRFIASMLAGGLSQLLIGYPVLARHLSRVVDTWVDRTTEFGEHLSRDLPTVTALFADGAALGQLARIEPALSDPHDGRKRVIGLEFERGLRVIYKPRPVRLDVAFFELLAWARARGLDPAQRSLRVLDRDTYGWVEYARQEPFKRLEDVATYFRQCGGLICFAHVLRGSDLHMENIVATADGPVIVDTETFLRRARRRPDRHIGTTLPLGTDAADVESCLTTGMVSLIESGPDGDAFDIGGLRGTGSGPAAVSPVVYSSLRSDDLAVRDDASFHARTSNAVVLDGTVQRPERFAHEIVEGFERTYSFLQSHRDELLSAGGPLSKFRGAQTRVLMRPSNQYAALAHVLARPRYQSDGARRSIALETLARPFARSMHRPESWPTIQAEREAMEALDIPRFTVPSDGSRVTSGGRPVLNLVAEPTGMELVEAGVGALSEARRLDQSRRLGQALAETVDSRFSAPFAGHLPEPGSSDSGETRAALLAGAEWIARELSGRAESDTRFPAREPGVGSDHPTIRFHQLYDGSTGTMLALAALARVIGTPEWSEQARDAAEHIRESVERALAANPETPAAGGLVGLGSVAYAFCVVHRLTGLAWAGEFAARCAGVITPDFIDHDDGVDVVAGLAGTMLTLLAASDGTRSGRLIELAVRCGERLIAKEIRPGDRSVWESPDGHAYVGFAHGTAGIGVSMLRLHERTGDNRFLAAGTRAIRSLLAERDESTGQWPLVHEGESGTTPSAPAMAAWCHGAPGIALALASALDIIRDDALPGALLAAADGTSRAPRHTTEHVCCGNLGRAEAILTAGRALDLPGMEENARALGLEALGRAVVRQHFRLSPDGFRYAVHDAGFFKGLSGIAYEMVRLAAPGDVPSILALT